MTVFFARFAVRRHFVALFCHGVHAVSHIGFHYGVVRSHFNGLRVSALPVFTRQVRYVLVCGAFVNIDIGIVEKVGYVIPRCRGLRVFFEVVRRDEFLFGKVLVAVIIHTVGGRFTLCRKDIVERVVRAFADRKIVVARFQNVSLIAVGIVSSHFFRFNGYFYDFTAAVRFERGSFFKAHEFDGRFFYSLFLVVGSIRLLQVYLNYFLAVRIARVGYFYAYFVIFAFLFHLIVGIFESRVRKPVTERESHFVRVLPVAAARFYARVAACVALRQNGVLVSRFVVAIAEVNAFRVNYILCVPSIGVRRVYAVLTFECKVAEVFGCRRGVVVVNVSVHESAARRYLARERVGDLLKPGVSAHAYPHASVDIVVFDRFELNGVRGVDEKNYFLYFFLFLCRFERGKNGNFVSRQIEIVAVDAVVAFVRARAVVKIEVKRFAAVTLNDNDSRVLVFRVVIGYVARLSGVDFRPRHFVDTRFLIVDIGHF